jgi:glutathione peroxidase
LYQEPGTSEEIQAFVLQQHGVTFPLMQKVDCGSSSSAHPLFPFLTSALPEQGLLARLLGDGIKW